MPQPFFDELNVDNCSAGQADLCDSPVQYKLGHSRLSKLSSTFQTASWARKFTLSRIEVPHLSLGPRTLSVNSVGRHETNSSETKRECDWKDQTFKSSYPNQYTYYGMSYVQKQLKHLKSKSFYGRHSSGSQTGKVAYTSNQSCAACSKTRSDSVADTSLATVDAWMAPSSQMVSKIVVSIANSSV